MSNNKLGTLTGIQAGVENNTTRTALGNYTSQTFTLNMEDVADIEGQGGEGFSNFKDAIGFGNLQSFGLEDIFQLELARTDASGAFIEDSEVGVGRGLRIDQLGGFIEAILAGGGVDGEGETIDLSEEITDVTLSTNAGGGVDLEFTIVGQPGPHFGGIDRADDVFVFQNIDLLAAFSTIAPAGGFDDGTTNISQVRQALVRDDIDEVVIDLRNEDGSVNNSLNTRSFNSVSYLSDDDTAGTPFAAASVEIASASGAVRKGDFFSYGLGNLDALGLSRRAVENTPENDISVFDFAFKEGPTVRSADKLVDQFLFTATGDMLGFVDGSLEVSAANGGTLSFTVDPLGGFTEGGIRGDREETEFTYQGLEGTDGFEALLDAFETGALPESGDFF